MRIFVSGLRKLVRRLATWLTFGLMAGLLVLILISVAATAGIEGGPERGPGQPDPLILLTFPGAYDFILSFVVGLGGLFAVVYGAAVAGSEWGWGTLKVAVARGESRSGYVLATFAAVAVMIGIGLLFALVVGIAAGYLAAGIAGVPTDGITDADAIRRLPEQFGRGWYAVLEQGAIGFTVATLARSQLAGIAIGIALYFGEAFAGIFLSDYTRYLPFSVADAAAAIPDGGGFGVPEPMPQEMAMLLVGAWLIGSLVVTAVFTERAEITG